jgi:hypothetical protein
VTVAGARHAVSTAALARDRLALVALGASLPATTAYAYERHRARAYARALEDSGDAALGELAIAAAAMPPSAAVLAADGAAVHLLLGDPARSISSIALAARNDAQVDAFGRDVLLAATREAPFEWRRAAQAAALVRHPRAGLVALSAAFVAMGDRRGYRIAIAATALVTALFALLALPTLLVDGGPSVAGVTAPSFEVPPSVVVVPARTPPPRQRTSAPDAVEPVSSPSEATLVSATRQPAAAPSAPPGRPRAARPRPASPPAAPAPQPTPAPQPGPQPAPQPEPPTVSLAVAPTAPAPTTSPAPARNGKAKGHEKKAAKKAAPGPPAVPPPAAPAPEAQPPSSSEPPGQAKDKDKDKDKDKKDKQK